MTQLSKEQLDKLLKQLHPTTEEQSWDKYKEEQIQMDVFVPDDGHKPDVLDKPNVIRPKRKRMIFSFNGRATGGKLFLSCVVNFFVGGFFGILSFFYTLNEISGEDFGGEVCLLISILLVILTDFWYITVVVKRCHDFDKSGWWGLISLIPFGIFYLLFKSGTCGPNKYGDDPRERRKYIEHIDSKGWIYIINTGSNIHGLTALKIGKTEREPYKRLAEYKTSSPYAIIVRSWKCFGNLDDAEKQIHAYAKQRSRFSKGEVFYFDDNVAIGMLLDDVKTFMIMLRECKSE
jgi:uncharacterized membrane protein YhaH (DUF805 family)